MTDEEKASLRADFPGASFLRVVKDGFQCIIALPRKQATSQKEAAVALWHGATAKLP